MPSGFVASTTLLTSWGACNLADLTRLSVKRERAIEKLNARLTAMQADIAADMAAFDVDAEQQLAAIKNAEAKAALSQQLANSKVALQAAYDSKLAEVQTAGEADINQRLPNVKVDADSEVGLTRVVSDGELSSGVVDVTIAPGHVVRCAADCMFAVEGGSYLAASDLDGQTIVRIHADGTSDTFVSSSAPAVLQAAAPVYQIECIADTCCVGSGDSIFALVSV